MTKEIGINGSSRKDDKTSAISKTGFAPIAGTDAEILILGSLPGDVSIQKQEYYGHPRNQFWSIIAALFGEVTPIGYGDRIRMLKRHKIALWDVLKAADRDGSLDADINNPEPNEINAFIASHNRLRIIGLNGKTASRFFYRYLNTDTISGNIKVISLPSTSPANARLSFERKLEYWKALLFQKCEEDGKDEAEG